GERGTERRDGRRLGDTSLLVRQRDDRGLGGAGAFGHGRQSLIRTAPGRAPVRAGPPSRRRTGGRGPLRAAAGERGALTQPRRVTGLRRTGEAGRGPPRAG